MSFLSLKKKSSKQEDSVQQIGTETVALAGFDKSVREKLLMAKILAIKNINYSYHAYIAQLLESLGLDMRLSAEDRGSPLDISCLIRSIPKVNGLLTNTLIASMQKVSTIMSQLYDNRKAMHAIGLMELTAPAERAIQEVQKQMTIVVQGALLMKHEPTISEALKIKNRIAVDTGVYLDESAILTAKQEQNERARAANAKERIANLAISQTLDQSRLTPDQADKHAKGMDVKVRRIQRSNS